MKSRPWFKHLLCLALIVVVNLIVYRDWWLGHKVFTGSDFFRLLAPLLNYQSDCLRGFSWPLWNPFMNFGYPWVGHYVNSSLFPTHLLMGLIGSTVFLFQLELLGWIIIAGIAIYLCVWELGYSRRAALIAGISFMLSGQLTVFTQWGNQLYNAALFPLCILGYLRAKKSSNPLSLITIISLVSTLLGGYLASSVLGMYFFAGYVFIDSLLGKKLWFAMKFLVITYVSAALLSLPKLLPLLMSMTESPRLSLSALRDNPPYGIFSYHELMSLLLPVKFYFSIYIGGLWMLVAIYALFQLGGGNLYRGFPPSDARAFGPRCLPLSRYLLKNPFLILFALSAWFLIVDGEGGYSWLRVLGGSILPFIKSIRFLFSYWYYPLIFLILYLAKQLEAFLSESDARPVLFTLLAFNLLLAAGFFSFYNPSLHWQAYLFHASLSLAISLLLLLKKQKTLQGLLVVSLVALDLSVFFSRVNIDLAPVRSGDKIAVTFSHQNFVSRSFKDKELVHERWTEVMTDDSKRPGINEARSKPYLALGSDVPFVLNIIEAMNGKAFTGIWYNPQETKAFKALRNEPRFQLLDGMPLYYLDRGGAALSERVSFDKLTCTSFSFGVAADTDGELVLRQMYDKRWQATVDGKATPLLRKEGYFMGVPLAKGRHKVEWVFRDKIFTLSLWISGATFLALVMFRVLRRRRAVG